MKVLQISKTCGNKCGIALFADKVQTYLRQVGIDVETVNSLMPGSKCDIVLLQHHDELLSNEEVVSFVEVSPGPVVLFAHSENTDEIYPYMDGLVAMCPGMFKETDIPTYLFSHPAWTPSVLQDRADLRDEFGLPKNRLIVGSNGFLKFERQFVEIVDALIPEARRNDWFIDLITSPWLIDSPGLIPKLETLVRQAPSHFRFEYAFLDTVTLNRRLQACDTLWCWTKAPSSAYASGVISDQYASGTRIFATTKQQHHHVLSLPNVVAGPDTLASFIDSLIAELRVGERKRHDPSPVSWNNIINGFVDYLRFVVESH